MGYLGRKNLAIMDPLKNIAEFTQRRESSTFCEEPIWTHHALVSCREVVTELMQAA